MRTSYLTKFPMFSKTVTVYNKFFDGEETIWYRTVLNGCSLKTQNFEKQTGADVVYPNAFVGRIPENPGCIPKREWDLLENKERYCTFSPGDLVIPGVVEEEIPKNKSGAELAGRFGGFFIDSVTHNDTEPIAHWKIEGRANRHLY